MRLTCPNCGAEYDVPEGMVPAGGRHAQCSACHTRWFVHGPGRAVSEEQILTRLESWRPHSVPAAPAAAETLPPLRIVPSPEDEPGAPSAEVVESAPRPAAEPAPAPLSPPRREVPAKPADRPMVSRPTPVPDAPLRPAPRLDLHRSPAEPRPEPAPPSRSRFLPGLLVVLVPALIAFAAYRFADEIAAMVPPAEPALEAYTATIDGWREDLARALEPYRFQPPA